MKLQNHSHCPNQALLHNIDPCSILTFPLVCDLSLIPGGRREIASWVLSLKLRQAPKQWTQGHWPERWRGRQVSSRDQVTKLSTGGQCQNISNWRGFFGHKLCFVASGWVQVNCKYFPPNGYDTRLRAKQDTCHWGALSALIRTIVLTGLVKQT